MPKLDTLSKKMGKDAAFIDGRVVSMAVLDTPQVDAHLNSNPKAWTEASLTFARLLEKRTVLLERRIAGAEKNLEASLATLKAAVSKAEDMASEAREETLEAISEVARMKKVLVDLERENSELIRDIELVTGIPRKGIELDLRNQCEIAYSVSAMPTPEPSDPKPSTPRKPAAKKVPTKKAVPAVSNDMPRPLSEDDGYNTPWRSSWPGERL